MTAVMFLFLSVAIFFALSRSCGSKFRMRTLGESNMIPTRTPEGAMESWPRRIKGDARRHKAATDKTRLSKVWRIEPPQSIPTECYLVYQFKEQEPSIGIGKRSPAVPATPPCVRVRTRRFGEWS